MDLIYNKNKTPFTVDASLWIKSLQRRPGYENLLGFEDLMNEKGKHDTDAQAEVRRKFVSRDAYIRHYGPLVGYLNALTIWNNGWAGHPNPPGNFLTGDTNMRWETQFRDFAGDARLVLPGGARGYFRKAIPPNYFQRKWLQAHPNYGVTGFRGNPNNPIIQRRLPGAIGALIVPHLPAGGGAVIPGIY